MQVDCEEFSEEARFLVEKHLRNLRRELQMNSKFEVELKIDYWTDPYDVEHPRLLNVTPKALSLSCPHCQVYAVMKIDDSVKRFDIDDDYGIAFNNAENLLFDFICSCPDCDKTVFVQAQVQVDAEELSERTAGEVISVYPYRVRVDVPSEVPEKYASDFREAVLVLDLSPMASAALSRRILQHILRDEFDISGQPNLAEEIKVFISECGAPSHLTRDVDAIKTVGNFAAHPTKYTSTGEVVAVEPGEADWLISVLNSLFDHTFVQPRKSQERLDRLHEKSEQSKQEKRRSQAPDEEIERFSTVRWNSVSICSPARSTPKWLNLSLTQCWQASQRCLAIREWRQRAGRTSW